MISMDRGDVTQSSFGFYCIDDTWEDRNGKLIRTVLKAMLFDVSPVTFPAYPDATAGTRDLALRSAPAAIRAKLSRKKDAIDAIDAILDDPDDDDDDDDSSDDDDNDCDCDCDDCQNGDCEQCSDPECDSEFCSDCPAQTRAAHLDLIARKMR